MTKFIARRHMPILRFLLIPICFVPGLYQVAYAQQASQGAVIPMETTFETNGSEGQEADSTEKVPALARLVDLAKLNKLRAAPHVYFRSVHPDEFGHIVVTSLADQEKDRLVTDLLCERAYFDNKGGICLVDNRMNIEPLAYALLLDQRFEVVHRIALDGFPSRARLSPDGKYAASTIFAAGDSYNAEFSTRTMIVDRQTGKPFPDLEQFDVYLEGKLIEDEDFNFWGVTFFSDSNRFHATLRTDGQTFLVLGDLAKLRMEVLRTNVECPSLSPDETRIAYKYKVDKGKWRLHILELDTRLDYILSAEERSIDDQVEWLDDEQLLYGTIDDHGLPKDAMNVWRISVFGGKPVLFLKGASSPAVIR